MPRFIYNNVGGGLNQGQPPQTLADNEWVDHRNAYPFGGSIHCATADVYREGRCQDYFPKQ